MCVPWILSLPETEPVLVCASSVRVWVCCSRERDGISMRGESCLVTSLVLLALLPPAARIVATLASDRVRNILVRRVLKFLILL